MMQDIDRKISCMIVGKGKNRPVGRKKIGQRIKDAWVVLWAVNRGFRACVMVASKFPIRKSHGRTNSLRSAPIIKVLPRISIISPMKHRIILG